MKPTSIKIADFDYPLPPERIAKYPLAQRDQSKLLVFKNNKINDACFKDISKHLPTESLLIFNDSKVMPVRLKFPQENSKPIEIFCLEPIQNEEQLLKLAQWKCFVGNARKWKTEFIFLTNEKSSLRAKIISKEQNSFAVQFEWSQDLESMQDVFETFGAIPIPPYLNRKSEAIDTERYQNVFAHHNGSVAAPTAGLHFTEALMEDIKSKGIGIDFVTLHVGAGTFKPVNTDTIGEHVMHMERMLISKNLIKNLIAQIKKAKPITAVGTTSLRTLESIYWLGHKLFFNPNMSPQSMVISQWAPYESENKLTPLEALQSILNWLESNKQEELFFGTEIIITPSYEFKIIDVLITNFHQPKSTLLLLVAAVTNNKWAMLYDHALAHDYRFLSYGDSNLLFIDRNN